MDGEGHLLINYDSQGNGPLVDVSADGYYAVIPIQAYNAVRLVKQS